MAVQNIIINNNININKNINNNLFDCASYKLVSFNMHGFNQGWHVINDLIKDITPDVFLLQEHWLTPANLNKFDEQFGDHYFCFGGSAMSIAVESGPIFGRPYGGLMFLINKELRKLTETIHYSERYAVIKVENFLVFNVYLPCVGTQNRQLIVDEILSELYSWHEQYASCVCIVCGDLNVDLDDSDKVARMVKSFCDKNSLKRSDILFNANKTATYVNTALSSCSAIDYILISSPESLTDFRVLDPKINFSDHVPIMACIKRDIACYPKSDDQKFPTCSAYTPLNFRWDKADITSYYNGTGFLLQSVLSKINDITSYSDIQFTADMSLFIDSLYSDIINVLNLCANSHIPQRPKNFYKFWWDLEMESLKEASINSNELWKAAGRPRHGPIFQDRQACRMRYRKGIRERQQLPRETYSNELHEALLKKDGHLFWNCWRSKFGSSDSCDQVSGCSDAVVVANNFMQHFSDVCRPSDQLKANNLKIEFENLKKTYCGSPLETNSDFDVELVSNVISKLSRGKAPGLDNITAEHLQYCHPALPTILTKLFNLMLKFSHVPVAFGQSYTVPLPKVKDCRSKVLSVNDFRGIAISPMISKVFELCILDRFSSFLTSCDNQFGFKKGIGCNHAIYTVHKLTEYFIKGVVL